MRREPAIWNAAVEKKEFKMEVDRFTMISWWCPGGGGGGGGSLQVRFDSGDENVLISVPRGVFHVTEHELVDFSGFVEGLQAEHVFVVNLCCFETSLSAL